MKVCPPTCAAGGTWLGCGRRSKGYGTPCDGLEFLDASTGVAQRVCFFGLRTRKACPNYAPVCLPPTSDSGQSSPRLWVPTRIFKAQLCCLLSTLLAPLRFSWCPSLCLPPPPSPLPLSPYNCTCPSTLPPNRRVFLWSLRAPSPR